MIESLSQILNFRYNKKFLDWDLNHMVNDRDLLTDFPDVFNFFKIVIHHHGVEYNKIHNNHVFCVANKCSQLMDIVKTSDFSPGGILVVAGEDDKLSHNIKYINEVKELFDTIYYEAKDIQCDWIHATPMGVNVAYLLRAGGSKLIDIFNSNPKKDKLIGAAFGSKWPHLTDIILDRKKLEMFVKKSTIINDIFSPPVEFFTNLSRCTFFACPLGNGVQTPKIFECLLTETIPIVTDHFIYSEIKKLYDIPILIINEWEDIREDTLQKFNHTDIDWQAIKSKLTVDYFYKKNLE